MQRMVLVENKYVYEINTLLEQGWKVVSVTPIIKCVSSGHDISCYGAYVVIEKEDGGINA